MQEALKGIDADLKRVQAERVQVELEHERRQQELEDEFGTRFAELDVKTDALRVAREAIEAIDPQEPTPPKDPPRRSRTRKPKATNGNGHYTPEQAAQTMIEAMRRDGEPRTERQLGELAGLRGQGAHNTRLAAVRRLLASHDLVLANTTSTDGTRLFALGGQE